MSSNRYPFTDQAARGFVEDMTHFAIGGTIWREVQSDTGVTRQPWPRLSVQIAESGRFAETDEQGRFRFFGLQPGTYRLLVRQKVPPPQEGPLLKDELITVAWPPSYDLTVAVDYRQTALPVTNVTASLMVSESAVMEATTVAPTTAAQPAATISDTTAPKPAAQTTNDAMPVVAETSTADGSAQPGSTSDAKNAATPKTTKKAATRSTPRSSPKKVS